MLGLSGFTVTFSNLECTTRSMSSSGIEPSNTPSPSIRHQHVPPIRHSHFASFEFRQLQLHGDVFRHAQVHGAGVSAQAADSASACSNTVSVAFSRLSGG